MLFFNKKPQNESERTKAIFAMLQSDKKLSEGQIQKAIGFIDEGIDPLQLADNTKESLLFVVAGTPYHTIADALLQKHPVLIDVADTLGRLPFRQAVRRGTLAMVQTFCAHGANVNTDQSISRSRPLMAALERRDVTILNYLLQQGADANACDGFHHSVLELAVDGPSTPEMVTALLHHGVDPNTKRHSTSETMLHMAVEKGKAGIVRVLLQAGADPEARHALQETPLLLSLEAAGKQSLELLLAAGASVRALANYANPEEKVTKARHYPILARHIAEWQPRYEAFLKHEFTPQTQADWLGLASVMPLKDPKAYSSVKERVEQLMDWHKGLKALRTQAAKQSPTIAGLGV